MHSFKDHPKFRELSDKELQTTNQAFLKETAKIRVDSCT